MRLYKVHDPTIGDIVVDADDPIDVQLFDGYEWIPIFGQERKVEDPFK